MIKDSKVHIHFLLNKIQIFLLYNSYLKNFTYIRFIIKMLLSYNFFVFYLQTSLAFFVRDIFSKDLCIEKEQDYKIIADYKKVTPIVIENCLQITTFLLVFDVYYLIFGSDYGVINYIIYTIIGFPVLMALFFKLAQIRNFNYEDSRNTLMAKSDISTQSFYFSLYVEPEKFNNVLRIWLAITWMFLAISETVINCYIYLIFLGLMMKYGNFKKNIVLDEYFNKVLNYMNNYSYILDNVANICNKFIPRILVSKCSEWYYSSNSKSNTLSSEELYKKDKLYSVNNKQFEKTKLNSTSSNLDDIPEEDEGITSSKELKQNSNIDNSLDSENEISISEEINNDNLDLTLNSEEDKSLNNEDDTNLNNVVDETLTTEEEIDITDINIETDLNNLNIKVE